MPLRFPKAATTISPVGTAYTFDDVSGDTSLSHFDITKAPSYVFSVINDIKDVNPYLKVHLLPWSPVSPPLAFSLFSLLIISAHSLVG